MPLSEASLVAAAHQFHTWEREEQMETAVTAIITPAPSDRPDGGGAVAGLPSFLDGTQHLVQSCQACGMHVVLLGSTSLLAKASRWELKAPLQLTPIQEAHPAQWLSSALRTGVQVSAQASGWVLLPSGLTPPRPHTLTQLRQALRQHLLVYPSHGGRVGMPMGFGQELFSELIRLNSDRELLRLMNRYPAQPLELDDPTVLMQAWERLFPQVGPIPPATTTRDPLRG